MKHLHRSVMAAALGAAVQGWALAATPPFAGGVLVPPPMPPQAMAPAPASPAPQALDRVIGKGHPVAGAMLQTGPSLHAPVLRPLAASELVVMIGYAEDKKRLWWLVDAAGQRGWIDANQLQIQ